MEITVIKRDGSREPFSLEKLEKVITAAGLTAEKAKPVLQNIEAWSKSLEEKEITSLHIRDKVLAELALTDDYAAKMFSWYQQTKEKQARKRKK